MHIPTEYLLLAGDKHSGSLRGLQHPGQQLKTDGVLAPRAQTAWQKTIWDEVYIAGLDKFAAIVGDDPITVEDGGDCVHGNHIMQDTVTNYVGEQEQIAELAFSPIYERFPNVKVTLLLIGTTAHSLDDNGTVEEHVRDRIRNAGHYAEVIGHGVVKIGEILVDMAHIGTGSGQAYNRGSGLVNYLKGRMQDELDLMGNIPPALYVRHHFHDWAQGSWTKIYRGEAITSHIILCPPLTGMNAFARGATRSNPIVHIGMILVKITGKTIAIIPHVRVYDVREYVDEGGGVHAYTFRGRGNNVPTLA